MKGDANNPGTMDDQPEPDLLVLQRRLEEAERRAERALRNAQLAEEAKRQMLSSTSWKITAPLRGFRTFLGAPPPIDASLETGPAPVVAETAAIDLGDSLLPAGLPESMLANTPAEAERSNTVCRILHLDWTMEGILPESLWSTASAVAGAPVSRYLGDEARPPRIAFLGTPELADELSFEAAVTALPEDAWRAQLAAGDFQLLLLEPVLHVGNRDWRGCMAWEGRGRAKIEALLRYARERGIPSVLWFRAGASELDHFAWIAKHVDAVYAVSPGMATALEERAGRPVAVLAPAIQPALHNPLRTWEQLGVGGFDERVLFDGWLDLMEGGTSDPLVRHFKDSRLLVAESEWEFGGVRLNDVPEFKRNAAGCLSSIGKAALARMVGAEIFRESPLVPDWRREQMIQRSIACGTIAADGSGTRRQWGGLPLLGAPEELAAKIEALLADPLGRARMRHLAFREIFSSHCLADRLNQIATDLKLDIRFGRKPASVAGLLVTMRPQLLERCLDRFRADRYPHKELVVVLHGNDISLAQARSLIRPGEPISMFQLGKSLSLGDCLNFAASQTDAEYWAKFDDDDLYGPNYLSDIMLYRRATDFELGGKPAAFIYSEGEGKIRWDQGYAKSRALQYRRANRGERIHIAGGTLVGKRRVLQEVPFSDVRRRGSDTDVLRRADQAGLDFIAFDFFNFALFRSGDDGFHTWKAGMDAYRGRTQPVGDTSQAGAVIYV